MARTHVRQGLWKYREAVDAYPRALRREKSMRNYCGRAEAYSNLKMYDEAIADFYAAEITSTYTSTHRFERIGVVNWLAERSAKLGRIPFALDLANTVKNNEGGGENA